MTRIPESELILNQRGAIYHLNLRPEEIADTIITVGDPARVAQISKHFDSIEIKSSYREFITHTGFVGKKRLTVLSSGIGTDNIDIVLNELDALANVNFHTRTIVPNAVSLKIMRIGTCGSLQEDIPVDTFVASTHGLGIDNLLNYYRHLPNDEEKEILQAFVTHTQIHHQVTIPYITGGAPSLIKHFVGGFHHGITVSCPGFYGPQGRMIRVPLSQPDLVSKFSAFRIGNHRISNFEMETSAIYGLGKLLGHHCLSLNAVVANRVTKEFSKDLVNTVERLIVDVLGKIERI
ncbi:MAG: nucleoside phosphorylase [Chitinophagaceae bacterium]|nr:nucleoside phosphorylase [Chitinophagaceae bacterium]